MKEQKRANHLILLQNLSDRLIWMEVKREGEKLSVLNAGTELFFEEEAEGFSLPADTPLERLQNAITHISTQIRAGWMTTKDVVFVTPSHRLTARFLETPPTAEDTVRDLVAFEVAEALQIPNEAIAWDMLISSGHEEAEAKHVLWIAARKEYLDGLLKAWPENKLEPTEITADFWAPYEYLLQTNPLAFKQPTILVSQEGNRATISVVTQKAMYFSRSVTLSRARMADGQADERKERQLALEIQRTLTYVSEQFPAQSFREMYLCGFENWDLSPIKTLAERNGYDIKQLTKEHTSHFLEGNITGLTPDHLALICMAYCQLLQGIYGPSLVEEAEEGFSLQSLVPEAAIPSQKFIATAGGLLAFFLLLWIGQQFWYQNALSNRLAEGQELLQLSERLHKEEQALRTLKRTNIQYADLFLFLAQKDMLPNGILINSISLDAKSGVNLVLKGGNHKAITDFVDKLNESKFFRNLVETRAVHENDGFTVYLNGKLLPSS